MTKKSSYRYKTREILVEEINALQEENNSLRKLYKEKCNSTLKQDNSTRKNIEEALILENENFKNSIVSSPLGILISSTEGETLYANKTILDYYGYKTIEELQNTPQKDRYTPESYSEALERKQRRKQGDLSDDNYEISIIRRDKTIRHLHVFRGEILWDGAKQLQAIYIDITERKNVERLHFQQAEDIRLINRLNQMINQGESLDNLKKTLADKLIDMFGCNVGSIYLLDAEKQFIISDDVNVSDGILKTIESVVGIKIPRIRIPIKTVSFFKEIVEKKKAFICNDQDRLCQMVFEYSDALLSLNRKKPLPCSAILHKCKALNIKGIIITPLIAGNEVIGFLSVPSSKPFTDNDLIRIETIGNQITRVIVHKRTEDILAESEAKYRSIVQIIPDGVIIHTDNRIVFANEAAIRIINARNLNHILGKNILDFVHPDFKEIAVKRIEKSLKNEKTTEALEETMITMTGQHIQAIVTSTPFIYSGNPSMLTVLTDITQRKQVGEALKQSEDIFRNITEQVNDVIFMTDSIGIITYISPSAETLFGYKKDEIISFHIDRFLDEIDAKKVINLIRSYTDNKYFKPFRNNENIIIHMNNKNGSKFIGELSFNPFFSNNSVTGTIGVIRDMTKRFQVEEKIRESKELMERLNHRLIEAREDERKRIACEIHDQFGQAMTALKLDMNRMYNYLIDDQEAITIYNSIIGLISDTIKDIQHLSSELRPGILDDLGLVSAIEWYASEFEQRSGIKCTFKADDSDYPDPQKNLVIFRILQESLTNVIRHANASKVSIKLRQLKNDITLAIRDNGIGIPLEKVRSNKSLGILGMKERVKQYGGRIEIKSGEGSGTLFTISIPLKQNFDESSFSR